jgi:UDP-MurNAc hydroxylase
MQVFGPKEILLAARKFPYLEKIALSSGFNCRVVSAPLRIGQTTVSLIAHKPEDMNEIDSVIHVEFSTRTRRHSVLNSNDVIFTDIFLKEIKEMFGEIDVLLLGYTGAGPYPQTYFDTNDPDILIEAEKKKMEFFNRYVENCRVLNAAVNIPFAGKYLLGGGLARLNGFRGVADATEILQLDERAIVLADDDGEISTFDLRPSNIRTDPYSPAAVNQRLNEIKDAKFSFELIDSRMVDLIPLETLLRRAYERALVKSSVDIDYFIVIRLPNMTRCCFNVNREITNGFSLLKDHEDAPLPNSEIVIDPRYLYGLLTHMFHWNNAVVGSHLSVRRNPNFFNRDVQNFLNFLTV